MSNSPVTETGYSAEYLQDGVYSITTTTRYNAASQPLISVQKRLISELSGMLESKSVFVSERGLTSSQWTVYSGGTKRVQYSTAPGSAITAETVTVNGVALSQKDTAGITTTATRPPAIQKDGSWFTYGWDLTKNICELYGPSGYIRTAYTYSPYGHVTAEGDVEQNIQWSSEFNDTELGLIYYNYRHYNPEDGRWTGRDIIDTTYSEMTFVNNRSLDKIDILGAFSTLSTREGVIVVITTTRRVKGVTRVARSAANAVSAISQPSDSEYGDCTKEQHSRLHKDYSSFCKKNPHSCKDSFVNCCEKVKRRLANAKECHRRRKKLNDICFKGGGGTALEEVRSAKRAINTCMEKYKLYKCK